MPLAWPPCSSLSLGSPWHCTPNTEADVGISLGQIFLISALTSLSETSPPQGLVYLISWQFTVANLCLASAEVRGFLALPGFCCNLSVTYCPTETVRTGRKTNCVPSVITRTPPRGLARGEYNKHVWQEFRSPAGGFLFAFLSLDRVYILQKLQNKTSK